MSNNKTTAWLKIAALADLILYGTQTHITPELATELEVDRLIERNSDGVISPSPIGKAYFGVIIDLPIPQYKKVLIHPITGKPIND